MENKWKQWISRFGKSGKLPAKQQLFILLLAGILLVVIVSPVPDQEEERIGTGAGVQETEMEGGDFGQEYEKLLEKRVESTLECVEGVGKVKVMITVNSSKEAVVNKDSPYEQSSSEKEKTVKEDEQTILVEEDGKKVPYVIKEVEPVVEGVVVVAQGGGNDIIKNQIVEAVSVLFHISSYKVKVLKMEDS